MKTLFLAIAVAALSACSGGTERDTKTVIGDAPDVAVAMPPTTMPAPSPSSAVQPSPVAPLTPVEPPAAHTPDVMPTPIVSPPRDSICLNDADCAPPPTRPPTIPARACSDIPDCVPLRVVICPESTDCEPSPEPDWDRVPTKKLPHKENTKEKL